MTEWFENEEFWEADAPYLFDERRLLQDADEVTHVLDLAGLAPPARVLDLCCGVGRHALELARRGFQVTAVDRTPSYLERARGLAAQEQLEVEFVQRDMREFVRPQEFDAALSLWTSFGYFEDQADDLRVARNVCLSLRPGGRLVMEMLGKEILARILQTRGWSELPDGSLELAERKVTAGWDRVEERRILIRGSERKEFTFVLRLYSARELARLLQDAGFRNAWVYGSIEGIPHDPAAKRLVAVARK